MTVELLLNAAINLVVGLALVLVWRADRQQAFPGWLGASFLVQAISPFAFVAWRSPTTAWHVLGFWALIAAGSTSLTLWLVGAAHLAGRPVSRRVGIAGLSGLLIVNTLVLAFDPRIAQAFGATLTTLAALVALGWLIRLGAHERIAAVAMLLLGLNQYVWVVFGNEGLHVQAAIATVLRVVLGLALLHAALSRRRGETGAVRDQFMQLIERSHQGIAVMQGETMKFANPALKRMYGLVSDDGERTPIPQRWRDTTMPDADRAIGRQRHQRILSGELPEAHWEGHRTAFDGRSLHLRFSAWRVEWDGEPAEQVVVTDDTARFDAIRTLLHQATHDELTGLPNRSALLQRLRGLCAVEPPQPFALLLLDVDRFKLFNEAHGPSIGDEVLRALAAALQRRMTEGSAPHADVMRLGEDEFALLAPAANAQRVADELAQAVRQLLWQPLELPQHRFFLDVSMGVALHPLNGTAPEALLRAANAAMHEAKRTPGTSLQFAEERFERGSGATLDAEQALRAGMKSDEFKLVFQPKVDAHTGALVGFEALVRWDRPGIGRVGPNEFIPPAERTGLIGPLGNLILTLACHQIAEWRETFGHMVPVAVNVSPLQLLDPGFPDLVVRTLRHFNVPTSLLTLEITESAAITHLDQARGQIAQMRQHGIEVALDDFGTGFSSLNMLRSLPLSTVKIDRTLIDPMPDGDAVAVVKAICDLAAVLHLDVVAEGVETPAHASAAAAAGCKVLQGFLYARPLEPADAAQWMRGRPELKR
jgi:diguanylate cyclase (GGDEF)-like protein/PAS domain S-box-containing protein